MRSTTRLSAALALGLVLMLALMACSPVEDDGDEGADIELEEGNGDDAGDAGDDGADEEAAGEAPDEAATGTAPGFDDCPDDPVNCNSGERADGGTLIWVVDQTPDAWFPLSTAGGSVYTLQALYGILPHTGLWGPGGEYQFNMSVLAAEPEIINEDPLTVEWQLNPDAVWNDGTPITADDMIVTWHMNTSEGEGYCTGCRPRSSASADAYASVEGSEDGRVVTVTYKDGERDPEWFQGIWDVDGAVSGFYPAHIAEENGFDVTDPAQLGEYFEWLDATMPMFSGGPYRIESGDMETQVLKVPNESYWGETPATLDTVIVRFLEDEGGWVPAFQNGEIHGGSPAGFTEDVIRQFQDMPGVHLDLRPGPAWEHLDVNLDNTQLADVELRRAIFTAIDVDDMANRNFGAAFPDYTRRTNHVFDSLSEYHVDLITETGQGSGDLDLARQILADAGYEGYDGGTLTLDGEQIGPFRLRTTNTGVRPTSSELMQSYLAEIGIQVSLEPTSDLGGTLTEQDYDLMLFGWSGSPAFANSAFQYWHSSSSSNWASYTDPEVDALAEASRTAASLDEAAEHANAAMEIVIDDAYVLPLWDSPVYLFIADDYVNVRDNTNTSLRGHHNNHEWGLAAQ